MAASRGRAVVAAGVVAVALPAVLAGGSGCGSDELFGSGTGSGNAGAAVAGGGGVGAQPPHGGGGQLPGGGGNAVAGSGGATGGSTAGGSGGVITGGGGQGAGPVEDCSNEIDDDGDLQVDCADSDCGAFSCVPRVPGAVAYFSLGAPDDVCAAPTELGLYGACESCDCAPTSGSCRLTVESNAGAGCSNFVNTLQSGVCANTTPDGQRWMVAATTLVSAGRCDPVDNEALSTDYYGCQQRAVGSCADGGACVAGPLASGPTCVVLPGAVVCPPPYAVRHVVWPDTIGVCTCGCESAEQCEAPYVLLDSTTESCQAAGTVAPLVEQVCTQVAWSRSFQTPWLATEVQCAAHGALADGGAHTLCCEP